MVSHLRFVYQLTWFWYWSLVSNARPKIICIAAFMSTYHMLCILHDQMTQSKSEYHTQPVDGFANFLFVLLWWICEVSPSYPCTEATTVMYWDVSCWMCSLGELYTLATRKTYLFYWNCTWHNSINQRLCTWQSWLCPDSWAIVICFHWRNDIVLCLCHRCDSDVRSSILQRLFQGAGMDIC